MNIHRKAPVMESIIKLQSFSPATLLKRDTSTVVFLLYNSCETPILTNICF